jgi:hypothetical protein
MLPRDLMQQPDLSGLAHVLVDAVKTNYTLVSFTSIAVSRIIA